VIGLLRDFRDRRAAVVPSDQTWLDVITTGAAGLVAAIPLISKFGEWLAAVPYASPIGAVGLPVLGCAALTHVISSAVPVKGGDSMIVGGPDRLRYRYSGARRQTAKLLVAPLAALAIFQAARSAPNGITGRRTISGYVCSLQSGQPLEGAVEILDTNAAPVSSEPEALDRSGFFHSRLRPWGLRPASIRLIGSVCAGAAVPLPVEENHGAGCPADELAIRQPAATRTIFASCESGGKK
jgi:hypothetical protein